MGRIEISTLDYTTASLRFFGDDLIPDEISNLLGHQPTRGEVKGHVRIGKKTGQRITTKTGGWWLEAPVQNDGNLDTQISNLLQNLVSDIGIWKDLSLRFRADIFCGLFLQTGWDGLSLESSTLLMLGERRLKLEMCIYDNSNE